MLHLTYQGTNEPARLNPDWISAIDKGTAGGSFITMAAPLVQGDAWHIRVKESPEEIDALLHPTFTILPASTTQFKEDKLTPAITVVEQALVAMQSTGSSISLGWADGEDSDLWECSWITSGKRITHYANTPVEAVLEVYRIGKSRESEHVMD